MSNISHLKIIPLDNPRCHEVILDNIPIRATALNIDYQIDEIPEAVITINAIHEIDDHVLASFRFEPQNIRDCIKYLSLTLQLDDALNAAFIATIQSALTDLDSLADGGAVANNEQKAKFILDRLME